MNDREKEQMNYGQKERSARAGRFSALTRLFGSDGKTLGQKVIRSSLWVVGSMATTRLLGMVQTIILVRLLLPEDFGIMRVAGFVLALMTTFSQTGIGAAVIQRKKIDDQVLNSAWTIEVIRSTILFVLVFFLAPVAAWFYENPIIMPILRVISLKILFGGFNNIGIVLLRKDLNFRKHEILEIISNILAIALTVVIAFYRRDVWALAIGWAVFAVMKLIGSYIVHPFRPRLAFRGQHMKELLSFGLKLTGSGILIFISTEGDDALVGKVVGIPALGLYALAYRLSNLPAICITHVFGGVATPTYAKVQEDLPKLRQTFSSMLRIISVLVVPASLGLFLLSSDLVNVVYGAKYAPMLVCFQILIFYGFFRAIASISGPLFVGTGRPHLDLTLQIIRVSILAVAIYPATKAWGISGAGLATVLSMGISMIWAFWRVFKILGGRVLLSWAKDLLFVAGALAVMTAVVLAARYFKISASPFGLIGTVSAGAIVYGSVLWAIWPGLIAEGKVLARKAIS